jgi:tRNA pseudouridine55 synthase
MDDRDRSASGLLLIDKETGPTSAEIVRIVTRIIGKRHRLGHAGTLDPEAEGLLILLVGGATRLSDHVMDLPKIYEAVVRFGASTDTYDAAGQVTATADPGGITEQAIEALLPAFIGRIMQKPPAYSAIKVAGKRAYKLAREGAAPDLPEREVEVHELKLIGWNPPDATFHVRCGKGMYLRTLAHDIGNRLGPGGHVLRLRRHGIGAFTPSIKASALTPENWREHLVDGERIFADRPRFRLNARGALNLRRGLPIRESDFLERPREPVGAVTGVLDEKEELIAVARIGHGGALLERKIIRPL